MSKHSPRKSRWSQASAKEYRSPFGVVCYREGAWEGTVLYDLWEEDGSGALPTWQARSAPAGRHKRPRNAMMAVEEKARSILREYQQRVRIAFED